MHKFWLVLTYDLLKHRRIDDVIVKTFFNSIFYNRADGGVGLGWASGGVGLGRASGGVGLCWADGGVGLGWASGGVGLSWAGGGGWGYVGLVEGWGYVGLVERWGWVEPLEGCDMIEVSWTLRYLGLKLRTRYLLCLVKYILQLSDIFYNNRKFLCYFLRHVCWLVQ